MELTATQAEAEVFSTLISFSAVPVPAGRQTASVRAVTAYIIFSRALR